MALADFIYSDCHTLDSSLAGLAKILLESPSLDFSELSAKEAATFGYMVDIASTKYSAPKDDVKGVILKTLIRMRREGL